MQLFNYSLRYMWLVSHCVFLFILLFDLKLSNYIFNETCSTLNFFLSLRERYFCSLIPLKLTVLFIFSFSYSSSFFFQRTVFNIFVSPLSKNNVHYRQRTFYYSFWKSFVVINDILYKRLKKGDHYWPLMPTSLDIICTNFRRKMTQKRKTKSQLILPRQTPLPGHQFRHFCFAFLLGGPTPSTFLP